MPVPSIMSLFTSFFGGPKLINGAELQTMAGMFFTAKSGITALAGGGQAGATQLVNGLSRVDTVASANDSVALPVAIPGSRCVVKNNTANAMQVFGVASNPQNGNAGDTITAQGAHAATATGTGISQAAGVVAEYWCMVLGNWVQGSIS